MLVFESIFITYYIIILQKTYIFQCLSGKKVGKQFTWVIPGPRVQLYLSQGCFIFQFMFKTSLFQAKQSIVTK